MKWRTSLLSVLLSAGMLTSALSSAAAAPSLTVQVDGKQIEFASQQPVVDNGTTLVPLESILKALQVTLEEQTNDAITVNVDGRQVTITVQARTVDGVSYVPVRLIGETVGFEVRWDAGTRAVILTEKEASRGFLWEVKHDGNTVYLAGSMHIADSSFYPLAPAFEEAFAEADYLGVEVDVSKATDPKVQELIMNLGTYQDGTTLKDHVSAETYAMLGEILTQYGLQPNALDAYKPWVVESTLLSLQASGAGYESATGIDLYFVQKALERNIPIIELESYESQLNMFNNFSPELQELTLQAALNGFNEIDDSVDQMADMWKSGDEEGLLELTEAMVVNEEYNKAMLVDRNKLMADKIDGYLKGTEKAEYLIVVGAAHFLGEDGIIKLLEDKGYTVTRK
ncbi:hypothetical protein FHS18_006669 [Paenibacillus phyllosphaerae]|uniref:Copper amine oxidase-like N-terminal domain-containing protein n=1 Tax=Paenibacillus phyllosphaerae TaxID=274593 RepID=A0A7W5B554_9BACL|nr:TraB/GumN family protein [Paenibacillus phyllosphaerae]MBB3114548.1 hypothetical protein [Paenibacillus phyllosphaerae]